ncbi:MAG: hypothetical protein R3C99_07795 [Pirellulaceae bacterium]
MMVSAASITSVTRLEIREIKDGVDLHGILRKIAAENMSNHSLMKCFKVIARTMISIAPTARSTLIYLDPPFLTPKRHNPQIVNARKLLRLMIWRSSHHEYAEFIHQRVSQCHPSAEKHRLNLFSLRQKMRFTLRGRYWMMYLGRIDCDLNLAGPIDVGQTAKTVFLHRTRTFFITRGEDFTFNQMFTDYSPSANVDQILQQRARDAHGKSIYRRNEEGTVFQTEQKMAFPLVTYGTFRI